MHTHRFCYKLVSGLGRWFTIAVMVFALSACNTTGTSLTPTSTPKLPTPATVSRSIPVVTPAITPLPNTTTWKAYHNDRAGYSIEYPAGWTINEHGESNGADMTTFAPPELGSDGTGLTVIARNDISTAEEMPDMPNTRCQQVTIGELSGTRCFDTIAFSTMTTFVSQGRVYILASSSKRLDQNIYQHFLSSFTIKP